MPSTPRKSRRNFRPSTPATPKRLKGLFDNGQWHCDCTPRLPALCLQTKKAGANKGRWFYACQRERRDQCDFFLWEDLAAAREKGAVLKSPRSEPAAEQGRMTESSITTYIGNSTPPRPGWETPTRPRQKIFKGLVGGGSGGDGSGKKRTTTTTREESSDDHNTDGEMDVSGLTQVDSAGSATLRSSSQNNGNGGNAGKRKKTQTQTQTHSAAPSSTPSGKRKLADLDPDPEPDGDAFSDDDFDSDMERALVAIATDASQRKEPKSLTQEKAFLGPATPPTARRMEGGGLPTPVSRSSLLIASEGRGWSEMARKRVRFSPSATSPEPRTAADTPTPIRTVDAPSSPSSPTTPGSQKAPPDEDYSVTSTVLSLLADQPVAPSVMAQVRDVLNTHALRVAGVYKGRDMVRAALAGKEARIAELQGRVVSLENSRRMEGERVRELADALKRD